MIRAVQSPSQQLRRVLLVAFTVLIAALAATGPAASPAGATAYGISDLQPKLFDASQTNELNFTRVRLVLPWNAGVTTGFWNTWLDKAAQYGYPVLVAPSIDGAHDCLTGSCEGPSIADYTASLRALLAQYPGIDAVEAWNEPNHRMQPTAGDPALAARYFDAAAGVCAGRCTAVAGNMLDAPSMSGYLSDYRAALTVKPAVWGIHDYYDATYYQRSGLDKMLAIGSGPVWITEVGGLVSFKPDGGGELPYDEDRAADSLRWMFSLVPKIPRLERVYLYGMFQVPTNPFDSALLRVDGSERESMSVARAAIGPRVEQLPGPLAPALIPAADPAAAGSAGGSAATGAGATAGGAAGSKAAGALRLVGKRQFVSRTGLMTLTVRCVGATACAGRVRASGAKWAWLYGRNLKLAASASRTIRIRVPRAIVTTLRHLPSKKAWVGVCDGVPRCTVTTKYGLVRPS
jgi:hypothetical protein